MLKVGDKVLLSPDKGMLFEKCFISSWREYLGKIYTIKEIRVTGSIVLYNCLFYWPPSGLIKYNDKNTIRYYLEKRNQNEN